MSVQSSTNNTVYPFVRGGDAPYTKSITIKQDAGRAEVLEEKTVLALESIDSTPTAVAGTNTGDGTLTDLSIDLSTLPRVGDYVLTCVTAGTNTAKFAMEDPDGNVIGYVDLVPADAGVAVDFSIGGIVGTLTDGDTDFAAGDLFTITVAAGSGKYVPYDATVAGANIPAGIYYGSEIAAATLAAGDVSGSIAYLGRGTIIDKTLMVFEGTDQDIDTLMADGQSVGEYFNKLGFAFVDAIDTTSTQA